MDKKNFQDHPEGSTPAKPPKRIHIPYLADPDFSKPLFKIPPEARERMFARLTLLYGEAEAKQWMPELERIIKVHLDIDELVNQDANYKSLLIEWSQKEKKQVEFKVLEEIGEGFKKQYLVEVCIENKQIAKAQDYSIKGAEKLAAEKAYKEIPK